MIYGLCGAAQAGKDTVAQMILDDHGQGALIQIAAPLKAYLRDLFDWTEEHTDGHLKDVPDKRYPRKCERCTRPANPKPGFIDATIDIMGHFTPRWETCPLCNGKQKTYLTPRHAMQQQGGEFAEATYPSIYAVRAAREAFAASEDHVVAVITDCRFLRDIQAVIDQGGIIIEVVREHPDQPLSEAAMNHPSEVARRAPEFQALVTHRIDNSGSLDDLRAAVGIITKPYTE